MLANLKELKVDLNKTGFFITHLHADHMGLEGKLASPGSRIYYNQLEASVIHYRKAEEDKVIFSLVRWYSYYRR